jgi:hypothetical protein
MYRDNRALNRRLTIIGVLFVGLLICLIAHDATGNQFSPAQPPESYKPPLINPELLQNWLPTSSYQYVISGIDNYLQAKQIQPSSMMVNSSVTLGTDAYNFTILLQPQNQTHNIAVTIDNFSGIISTALTIDGQLQNFSVPVQSSSGTQISGLNALVSQGVTAPESNGLVTAIQNFAPSATSISINTKSITPSSANPNGATSTISYAFSISINHTTYHAKLECPSLTAIELFLTDPNTQKQVFDSGVIASQE